MSSSDESILMASAYVVKLVGFEQGISEVKILNKSQGLSLSFGTRAY